MYINVLHEIHLCLHMHYTGYMHIHDHIHKYSSCLRHVYANAGVIQTTRASELTSSDSVLHTHISFHRTTRAPNDVTMMTSPSTAPLSLRQLRQLRNKTIVDIRLRPRCVLPSPRPLPADRPHRLRSEFAGFLFALA